MWRRKSAKDAIIEIALVGVSALSGCSGQKEPEPIQTGRTSIEATPRSKPASSTAPNTSAAIAADGSGHGYPPQPTVESPPEEAAPMDEPDKITATEGETVAVADTKPGLTRIGAAKCKLCHKDNWQDDMLQKAHAHEEGDPGQAWRSQPLPPRRQN